MASVILKELLDGPQSQVSDAHLAGPYLRYNLQVDYLFNAGTIQLPVAYVTGQEQATAVPAAQQVYQSRPPCEIINVTKPYGVKVVTYDIIRVNLSPLAPDPTPSNPNEVLHKARPRVYAPKLLPNGRDYGYRIRGRYVYLLYQPYYTSDSLSAGKTQVDNSVVANNAVTPANFAQGLV